MSFCIDNRLRQICYFRVYQSGKKAGFQVLFQKRVRGSHQVSKRENTFLYCFRAFGNLMKPEARVFEIYLQR